MSKSEMNFEVITIQREVIYVRAYPDSESAGLFSSREFYIVERFERGLFGGKYNFQKLGEASDVSGIGRVIKSMIDNVSKINAV